MMVSGAWRLNVYPAVIPIGSRNGKREIANTVVPAGTIGPRQCGTLRYDH